MSNLLIFTFLQTQGLIAIDQEVFITLNKEWTNGVLDYVLYFWRNKYFWIPFYVFLVSYFLFNYRKEAYWLVFFLLLTFGISDFVSSSILKPSIMRHRPCHAENIDLEPRMLVDCGSGYSFTSSHAANHFGIAFFLIFTLSPRRWIITSLLIWALLVAYAQVYVGVHFPLDVICGGLLGVGVAVLTSALYKYSKRKMAL